MINLKHSSFFLPTKMFRELSILLSIFHESDLSQQVIAAEANLSGSMVNGYIKELRRDGLISVVDKNKRDKVYRLTDSGRNKLMRSLMDCSAEIVQLYSQARAEIIQKLQGYFNGNGSQRILLFGGADTAQLVNSALEQIPHVTVVAVVDRDAKKWGERVGNHIVQSPDIINNIKLDCIVISSFARQNEIYDSIKNHEQKNIKIIKLTTF